MTERLPDPEYFRIKSRGEAPSRVSAAQIRADYTALQEEIQRLRRDRGNARYLLARLALGEVTVDDVVKELELQPEIDRTVGTNEANAAYSRRLREEPWYGDEPDVDADPAEFFKSREITARATEAALRSGERAAKRLIHRTSSDGPTA